MAAKTIIYWRNKFPSGSISINEFYFNLTIGITIFVFSMYTFHYIRRWGEKLLKIKGEEKVLQEFL
ncbi:hypothetical protein B6U79_03260 [Candidatus Bathyarchaeota archaeon ex4484_231]|nr:MAG: hypothetical protein B6U79_03260 [Candidatus Bathyarchaeota archaeon ex4484_231]